MTSSADESSAPRPHPGRASSITLTLIDLILSAPSPSAAIRTLKELREELQDRWEKEMTLGEAGQIDVVQAELEAVLADLHNVVASRYPKNEAADTLTEIPVDLPEPPSEEIHQEPPTDPPLHFLGKGVSGFLHRHETDVERLTSLGLPILANPAALARALDMTINKLRWLAFHTDVARKIHYVQFQVPKRSGGVRTLSAPLPMLAGAQRWIFDNILSRLPVEPACHGFVVGRCTVSNALVHTGQAVVINLDLEGFFPSIGFPRVRAIFHRLGYSPAVATVLALLCTECPRRSVRYNGQGYHVAIGPRGLPQGACTSPALSNQVATWLDRRFMALTRKLGWRYTRYADDLTFSAPMNLAGQIPYLMSRVEQIALDEGFRINNKKTRVLRRHVSQKVTGLVVNNRVGVPRALVRRVRAILHRAKSEGLAAQNYEGRDNFRCWLLGMIAYVKMVRPEVGARLLAEFHALEKPTSSDQPPEEKRNHGAD